MLCRSACVVDLKVELRVETSRLSSPQTHQGKARCRNDAHVPALPGRNQAFSALMLHISERS